MEQPPTGQNGLTEQSHQLVTKIEKAREAWSNASYTSMSLRSNLNLTKKATPQMINRLFNTKQNLTNFSKPEEGTKTMSNIETIKAELAQLQDLAAKAQERYERKQVAEVKNFRSIQDLKRFKVEVLETKLASLRCELDLCAEEEEIALANNSVADAQINLERVKEFVRAKLDEAGINEKSCYRTSDTQSAIMLENSYVRVSLKVKEAELKIKEAANLERHIETRAKQVAGALAATEAELNAFWQAERGSL